MSSPQIIRNYPEHLQRSVGLINYKGAKEEFSKQSKPAISGEISIKAANNRTQSSNTQHCTAAQRVASQSTASNGSKSSSKEIQNHNKGPNAGNFAEYWPST